MNTYLILAIVFGLITLALFTLTVKHASKGERSAMWSGFTIVSLVVTVIVVGVYQQEKLYYSPKEIADNVLSKQIQDVVHAYYLTDDYYEADIPKFEKGEYRENTPLKFSDYTVTNIVKKPRGQYITIEKNNKSVIIYDPIGKRDIKLEQQYTFLGSPSLSYPFVVKLHYKDDHSRFVLF